MTRLERIRNRLAALERAGAVPFHYSYSLGSKREWVITPAGRDAMTVSTSELEWFLLGAESALSARVTV